MLCYLFYSQYKIAKAVMEEKRVVTYFLEHNKKILLLRRSEMVGTCKGRWAGISGYIEEGHTPYEPTLEEIGEETGLSGEYIELVR